LEFITVYSEIMPMRALARGRGALRMRPAPMLKRDVIILCLFREPRDVIVLCLFPLTRESRTILTPCRLFFLLVVILFVFIDLVPRTPGPARRTTVLFVLFVVIGLSIVFVFLVVFILGTATARLTIIIVIIVIVVIFPSWSTPRTIIFFLFFVFFL